MALFNKSVITNRGKELISKVMSKKVKMIFTKIEATDFVYQEQVNLNELTVLNNPKQFSLISDVVNKNNKVTLHTILDNEKLNNGYSINAIGIYAKEENGVEILFSVLVASEADFIPAKQGNNLTTINYDLVYTIDNSEKITIVVENAALATAEMINKEREERIAADENLKNIINSKEPAISKKSGFNLDKTNLTENDSNKLFTAKGALDLFNNLTTKISEAVNAAKEYFRTELVKKIDKTSISSSLTSTSAATVLSSAGAKSLEDKKLNIADAWKNHYKIIGNTSTATDLNTITDVGEYTNPQNTNKFTNSPVTNKAFILSVLSIQPGNPTYRIQILSTYDSSEIYKRIKSGDTWSSWWRVDGGDRLFLTGGTLTGNLALNHSKPYYEIQKNGVRHMLLGLTNGADDNIVLGDVVNKTYMTLRPSDFVFNKQITVQGTIVQNTANSGSSWTQNRINVKGGFWIMEYHNDPTTSGNMRVNLMFNKGDTYNASTVRYIRFEDISAADETVAYKSWVNSNRTWANLSGKPAFNNTVTSTSINEIATPNAVKTAYDRGSAALTEAGKKLPLTGGTISGNLNVTGSLKENGNQVFHKGNIVRKVWSGNFRATTNGQTICTLPSDWEICFVQFSDRNDGGYLSTSTIFKKHGATYSWIDHEEEISLRIENGVTLKQMTNDSKGDGRIRAVYVI